MGGIYVLSRFLKKQNPEAGKPDNEPRQPLPDRSGREHKEVPKALTFEELLREISESKAPAGPSYQPPPKPTYVDYDDEIEAEEAKSLETIDTRKDKTLDVYTEGKRIAFERPSLEETMKLEDTRIDYGKFKVFEKTKERDILSEYLKDLQDPDGLKKAVVMSEILNRKF